MSCPNAVSLELQDAAQNCSCGELCLLFGSGGVFGGVVWTLPKRKEGSYEERTSTLSSLWHNWGGSWDPHWASGDSDPNWEDTNQSSSFTHVFILKPTLVLVTVSNSDFIFFFLLFMFWIITALRKKRTAEVWLNNWVEWKENSYLQTLTMHLWFNLNNPGVMSGL